MSIIYLNYIIVMGYTVLSIYVFLIIIQYFNKKTKIKN